MREKSLTVTLRSSFAISLLLLAACSSDVRSGQESASTAYPAKVSEGDAISAEKALRALDDSAHIQSLRAISPHLIELSTSDGVAYVTRDFKHMIVGNVLDVKTGDNITEVRVADLQKVSWDSLPVDVALKNGTGSRKVFIVEDPNCAYCMKLHATLAKIPDLTVYSLVMPILGPQSQQMATQVMCSPNPAQAWSDLMSRGVRPAADLCEAGITKIGAAMASGQRLKVQSTPVMFFEDGTRVNGAVSAEDIEKALQRAKPVAKS